MRKTRRSGRKPGKKIVDVTEGLEILRPHAAGIDVGNAVHYVAVPPGRSDPSVQTFGSFTADLHRMAQWLRACRIDTVVMQATGVYWMGLYQVLESYGFQVYVVNAKYTKTLPGRKTDVLECQWLQKLHSFGLLNNSFLPPEQIRVLRTYLRQRENLVAAAGTCIQQMQKVLTEMNVQLANVISDLSGTTGMVIVQAILDGQRDPQRLAALADPRVKATRKQIAQSLEGHWREDLLFVLQQVHDLYLTYLESITACDRRIKAHLKTLEAKVDVVAQPLPETPRLPRRKHISPDQPAGGTLSHHRRGLDAHRWHPGANRPNRSLRSGTGHDALAGRAPLRLLAGAVSEQPNHGRQSHPARHEESAEPCRYRPASGRAKLAP